MVVRSDKTRSQAMNQEDAIRKLSDLISAALRLVYNPSYSQLEDGLVDWKTYIFMQFYSVTNFVSKLATNLHTYYIERSKLIRVNNVTKPTFLKICF